MTPIAMPSPYRGLVPYQEEDASYFFGRSSDVALVTANLLGSRLTLLYGASGVGKSSLLNAGVVPELRALAAANLEQVQVPELAVVVFRNWAHRPAQALAAAVRAAGAAVGQPPAPEAAPLLTALREVSAHVGGHVLVILDQFEDYFLYRARAEDSESFDDAFVAAVNEPGLHANFLLSIREDGLARLDQFKGRIPKLFDNYLRIEHLDLDGAREAIEKPVERYNALAAHGSRPVAVGEGLVDAVLSELRTGRISISDDAVGVVEANDEHIETPFLQLVMTQLWDVEVGRGSSVLRRSTFFEELGGARSIVQSHVRTALQSLTSDERTLATAAFRYLITPSRTKIALRAGDLAALAELPLTPLTDLLEKLTGSRYRILKPIAPPTDHPGAVSYEIWHDVLAQAILDWRTEQVRLADVEAARARAGAEIEAARRRAREEQAAARRHRAFAAVVFVLLLLSLAGAGFARQQRGVAQAEARNAGWRKLISDTRTVVSTDAELGVLLARHVLRETLDADSAMADEAADALARALGASRIRQSFMHGRDPESVVALGVLEHGAALAVLGAGNELFRLERDSAGMRPMGKPPSPVFRMAVAPDGARFAVALEGSVLQILRSADGALEKTIRLDGDVFDLAWSPDGRVLATATAGGGLTLWDAASARRLPDLGLGAAHWFNVLDFSPDGTLLAAADSAGAVRIWSTADGTMRQEICGSGDRMDAVRFDPTGRFLATTSSYYVVMLWTVEEHPGGAPCTSSPLRRFIGHFNTVFDLAFTPDGQTLATASADTTVRLWEVSTGKILLALVGHRSPVERIAFLDEGESLASASWDGTTRIWDVTGPADVFRSGQTAAGGGRMVVLSQDGRVTVRDTADGEVYRQGRFPDATAVALDASGERVAHAVGGAVEYFTIADGRQLARWQAHSWVKELAVSPDGRLVASGGQDGMARLWDGETGEKLGEIDHQSVVTLIEFSRDGRWLLSGAEDGGVWLWEIGKPLRVELQRHTQLLSAVDWSADGRWIATGGHDGRVIVSRLESIPDSAPHVLEHGGLVFGVSFSPDSTQLVVVGSAAARRFSVTDGAEILPALTGHDGWIVSGAFSADGRRIATASWDRTALVWDAVTGRQLARYSHDEPVRDLAFVANGSALLTVTESAQLRHIPLDHAALLQLADARTTRLLTAAECRTYLGLESCPAR